MADRPETSELLAEVRRTLLAEVAPLLSGMPRFQALMAANALSIVMRELACSEALAEAGRELPGSLIEGIRDGQLDGDACCHDALLRETAIRVAIWKPERLGADERHLLDGGDGSGGA